MLAGETTMADGSGDTRTARISAEEALAMHASGRPGKLETRITKPLTTARDLSLAYSPGVAEPCLHIARDADAGLRLHHQGQHGRGDLERHRRARPGQSRRGRLEAGDGGQGRAVQALRRHRRHRPRDRHRGRRRIRQRGALPGPASAASTWRTSRRRNASSSSSGCAN